MHSLCNELREKSKDFLGAEYDFETHRQENGTTSSAGSRFIETVRKALIARVRNQNISSQMQETNNNILGSSHKKISNSFLDTPTQYVSKSKI